MSTSKRFQSDEVKDSSAEGNAAGTQPLQPMNVSGALRTTRKMPAFRSSMGLAGILRKPKMEETKSTSSPFDAIPAELLQNILNIAVSLTTYGQKPSGERYFPYTALAVASSWRSVAIAAPELWSTIYVRGDAPIDRLSKKFRHHHDLSNPFPLHLIIYVRYGVAQKWTYKVHKALAALGTRLQSAQLLIDSGRIEAVRDLYTIGAESVLIPDVTTKGGAHPFLNLHELRISAVSGAACERSVSYFLQLGNALPELQKLVIDVPHWFPEEHFGGPPQAFPKLKALALYVRHMHQVSCWIRKSELPVLETLVVFCSEERRLAEVSCSTHGSLRAIQSVRRAALYGAGPTGSRVLLEALPNIEQLAINCDAKGQIPVYLEDPRNCPNISQLVIHNPLVRFPTRVREKIEKRVGTLHTVVLDADFAADDEGLEFVQWLEQKVEVAVWPVDDFVLNNILDRMSCSK